MRGGTLDRRITIQRPATIVDPIYGPQDGGWEDVATRIPAQVWDDLPGQSESVQTGLRMADRPARVRIRYMRDLSSDMRVILHDGEDATGDRVCEISGGPAEIGRREMIELTVRTYTS
jgi:head-tail adaptor